MEDFWERGEGKEMNDVSTRNLTCEFRISNEQANMNVLARRICESFVRFDWCCEWFFWFRSFLVFSFRFFGRAFLSKLDGVDSSSFPPRFLRHKNLRYQFIFLCLCRRRSEIKLLVTRCTSLNSAISAFVLIQIRQKCAVPLIKSYLIENYYTFKCNA